MKTKKRNKKNRSASLSKKLQRKLAMAQGFYDGRFKEKTIPDKKKEAKRRWARKKTDD